MVEKTGQSMAPAKTSAAKAETAAAVEQKQWTEKRLHNTMMFRSLALLGAIAAASLSSQSPLQQLPQQAIATVHMLAFGTVFGSMFYTTFIFGVVLYLNLPRQTFGQVQSHLFPKYFLLISIAVLLQLATLDKVQLPENNKSWEALAFALGNNVLNQFYVEPKATRNMFERYQLENDGLLDTERYKKLKKAFGMWHGISSLANLFTLIGLCVHAYSLASSLVLADAAA